MPKRTGKSRLALKKTADEALEILSHETGKVFFFDEGRFGMKPTIGRLWALRGVTPKIMVKPGYKNFYVYSAVDPSKGEHFSLILPWVNTDMMNLFLQQLSDAYPGHPILLIVDQAGWHKAKDLFSHSHIKIRYLPAYSPELNPVERLWKWLRKHVCRNRLFSSLEELADTLESSINSFSANFLKQLCHCSYM